MIGEASNYAVQLNRYILMPIGLWPLGSHASTFLQFFRSVSIFASCTLICFLLIPCGLHTFLEESDIGIRLKLIGPMSFCIMSISKYCSLVAGAQEIGIFFEHVETDWRAYESPRSQSSSEEQQQKQQELEVMRRNATLGRFLALVCSAFMYGGGIFYHTIMPLSSGGIGRRKHNLILDLENNSDSTDQIRAPRLLAYPVYQTLMHVEASPVYEIVFFVQLISGLVNYTVTIGACSLAAVFVVHVCGQLEIVMMRLRKLFERPQIEVNDGSMEAEIAEIVDQHIRALDFAKRVENNLRAVCFIEFVGCTMNICFLGYYFITEWSSRNTISTITYCTLLVSFTFNIFIFCYIGELLTEKCKQVGEITYSVNWYRLRGKRALDLIMIIVISSCRPVNFTAGKLVNLSMSSFCNVIKSAATYLNLLRTVV